VTPAVEPPFPRIGVAGLGLIGGSIALGVRSAWPAVEIVGVDRPEVSNAALARKAIDEGRTTVGDLGDVDLIVLATPVADIVDALDRIGRARLTAVVTDVGSTKRHIVAAAQSAGVQHFIGGHPMAGAERSGFDAARADLFLNRPWFLTPTADASAEARVAQLVRTLGATPVAVSPDAHDRAMAYVSHVPQLLAVGLMVAAGEAVGEGGLPHSGRAFDEMTRLAASSPDVWASILSTNADYVTEAVSALVAALPPDALTDPARLRETFAKANAWRARFDAQRATRG
jgi:prephenate dehydrogenase